MMMNVTAGKAFCKILLFLFRGNSTYLIQFIIVEIEIIM